MTNESVTPSNSTSGSAGLTSTLLAAWVFGLFYGLGLFLAILAVLSLAGLAVATFGSFSANGWILLVSVMGLLAILVGPALMGRYLTRSWRRGLSIGLLSVAAGMVSLVIAYVAAGPMDKMISSNPGAFLAVLVALSAAVAGATVVIRATESVARSWGGLALGILVGLGLAVFHSLVIAPRILQGDNTLHMTWQVPPIVWVSVVYFSQRADRSVRWRVLPVWALLELLSLALPFVSFPLLEALGLVF